MVAYNERAFCRLGKVQVGPASAPHGWSHALPDMPRRSPSRQATPGWDPRDLGVRYRGRPDTTLFFTCGSFLRSYPAGLHEGVGGTISRRDMTRAGILSLPMPLSLLLAYNYFFLCGMHTLCGLPLVQLGAPTFLATNVPMLFTLDCVIQNTGQATTSSLWAAPAYLSLGALGQLSHSSGDPNPPVLTAMKVNTILDGKLMKASSQQHQVSSSLEFSMFISHYINEDMLECQESS